ncbi:MAG: membrane protein insertase YidC [Treponema sp.]|nr:membrane protein insertase YidC [Treponema sp.]
MEKNTKLAIGLSALVFVVWLIIQFVFIFPKQREALEQQQIEQANAAEEVAKEEESKKAQFTGIKANAAEKVPESQYTIKTDKVEVVFTNKGGDIISYKLLEHKDKDTDSAIQMADSITANNRAFALSFGDNKDNSIIDDTFSVKKDGENTIIFTKDFENKDVLGNVHKFTLLKRYEFMPGEYAFKMGIGIRTYDANGLNIDGAAYTLRTSPQIGPHYDIKKNRYDVRQVLSLKNKKKYKPNISNKVHVKDYDWAGVGGKYFTILIKPEDTSKMVQKIVSSTDSESDYMNSQVFLTRNAVEGGQAVTVEDSYIVYIGPRSENEYKRYNSAEDNGWGISNARFNYALQSTGFLIWLEVPLKWALEMIQKLVKNWGVAIIILTIILRLLLFPLSKKSAEGTLKMQQLQPKLQELQEKYKDNKPKLNEELSKVYKEAGYNPMSGCLPMILQMFILFALYNVFNNYFEFRGATFVKGWIDDLSVGDSIWSWEKQIPLISSFTQNHLRLLPIIYLVSQLLNGKVTQYGNAGGAQSKGQMAFMMYGLPVLFFFMFYSVPSGLLLYWTVSNILQIGQQFLIQKAVAKKRAEMMKGKQFVNQNEIKFKGGKKKTR